jgi:hypothetical protein
VENTLSGYTSFSFGTIPGDYQHLPKAAVLLLPEYQPPLKILDRKR